jgi:N-acetylglucosaminyl-diphospho-decaprenol L-rhamnosyltransferase
VNEFHDLSIATTVHNNAAMSAAMLKSFVEHVGMVAEIVVVDDGSTPAHTASADARVVRNSSPLGFCKASDIALRNVRTPYALLVDADVLFQPGDFAGGFDHFRRGNWAWVNFRQRSFAGAPQNAFEQPLMPPWVFAAGNQVYSVWENSKRARSQLNRGERIASVEAAHSSCTLVNMDAFRAIGGFDPWYAQCQSDIEISLRFRKRGYGVGVDLGYEVKHEGAGGRTGGDARVLDLYRARVHLYEREYPRSRFYLRPLLFARHLLELLWFGVTWPLNRDMTQLRLRGRMLRTALNAYE